MLLLYIIENPWPSGGMHGPTNADTYVIAAASKEDAKYMAYLHSGKVAYTEEFAECREVGIANAKEPKILFPKQESFGRRK